MFLITAQTLDGRRTPSVDDARGAAAEEAARTAAAAVAAAASTAAAGLPRFSGKKNKKTKSVSHICVHLAF